MRIPLFSSIPPCTFREEELLFAVINPLLINFEPLYVSITPISQFTEGLMVNVAPEANCNVPTITRPPSIIIELFIVTVWFDIYIVFTKGEEGSCVASIQPIPL